ETGLAHVGPHGVYDAIGYVQHDPVGATAGLNDEVGLFRQAALVDVFGETADAVAAGFGFGAVCVKDPHFEVGGLAGKDEDDAVGADAQVAVAHFAREGGRVGNVEVKAFDEMVVVAE